MSDTSGSKFDPRQTNLELLGRTQQYLRTVLQEQVPDTLLTEAWDEFYRVYSELIRRFVISHGIRGMDVDDCVQEVWGAVATKLTEFERPEDRPGLRAWLYAVVRSKATDLIRRSMRRQAVALEAVQEKGGEPVSEEMDPAEIAYQRWEAAMVNTALAELKQRISEENYRILHLRMIEGQSEAEVAEAMGLTVEQVRYRKHRAQKKLGAILAVYTGEQFGED